MTNRKFSGEAQLPSSVLTPGQEDAFDLLVADVQADYAQTEKAIRHAAFAELKATVKDFVAFSEDANGEPQSYHTMYIEQDTGEIAERRVFAGMTLFPNLGYLLRVIVNDEANDGRARMGKVMTTQDFVISTLTKTLTFQTTTVQNDPGTGIWPTTGNQGPMLRQIEDSLRTTSGDNYNLWLPKVRGYPSNLADRLSITRHVQTATGILRSLNSVSLQPDVINPLGIL